MGSALFADGAAAALVSQRGNGGLDMDAFETVLTPVGEEAMAWNIGDEGFEMVLAPTSRILSMTTSVAHWNHCLPKT